MKGELWSVKENHCNSVALSGSTVFERAGPRMGAAALLVGKFFIVFGGTNQRHEDDEIDGRIFSFNTCEYLSSRNKSRLTSAATHEWSAADVQPSCRRHGHSMTLYNSKVVIIGGEFNGQILRDAFAYDVNRLQDADPKHWERLRSLPQPRTNHTAISYLDKLFM